MRDIEGETVASHEVPAKYELVASQEAGDPDRSGSETISGLCQFWLPFPEDARDVKITDSNGKTTTVQPPAVALRDLAMRLPSEAFENEDSLASLSTEDGEAEREALIDAAQRMGDALDQDAYTAANEILDSEIEPIIQNLNPDYPEAANVPDHDELQTRLDTISERVQTFADDGDSETTAEDSDGGEGGGGGGDSLTTERTSLHEKDGGPC